MWVEELYPGCTSTLPTVTLLVQELDGPPVAPGAPCQPPPVVDTQKEGKGWKDFLGLLIKNTVGCSESPVAANLRARGGLGLDFTREALQWLLKGSMSSASSIAIQG